MDKLIRKLEREGKIRKQTAGLVQIEALLRESMKDLESQKYSPYSHASNIFARLQRDAESGKIPAVFQRVHSGRWGAA